MKVLKQKAGLSVKPARLNKKLCLKFLSNIERIELNKRTFFTAVCFLQGINL